jgi:xanthine dehydrogenase accessory factor
MSPGYAADLRSREDQLRSGRQAFAMATVVRALRPTSAKAGDRALVLPDGSIEGFVGGDCAESSVRLHALHVLATGDPVMLRIVPAEDVPGGPAPASTDPAGGSRESPSQASTAEGMVTVANPCASGGMLEIFLEGVFPPPLVQVHGDGPTARAVRDVGAALGYQVDPVPSGGKLLPDAAAVIVAAYGRDEVPVLEAAIAAGVPYIGLVASRKRGWQVLRSLDVAGDDALSRVRTPAGLDIGARTPPEVALSIFAQIVAENPRRERVNAVASPAAAGNDARSAAGPATATDPVCGMSVAVAETTLKLPHDGGVWYFCGPGCRQAFADDPGRYLANTGTPDQRS